MRTIFIFLAVLIAHAAHAQPYPHKPVRVVVPSQAGGGADIVARAIAYKMSEAFGQQVVPHWHRRRGDCRPRSGRRLHADVYHVGTGGAGSGLPQSAV